MRILGEFFSTLKFQDITSLEVLANIEKWEYGMEFWFHIKICLFIRIKIESYNFPFGSKLWNFFLFRGFS
ncbi:hypothetical protein DQM68_06750 [Leptospira mayottensis]|uniref:Uncharacterized protein n=1 Tax=Leptospira mayottensis TaxID=1137606 RepID=A0ABN5NU96_9LEPT|nr:hypothetical protein DQM68_06750 [Leptospira mayottensis]AXR64247.1 hypothetical protein DQM28_08455 [Leptospira mayottensis]AZQ03138.1 hypothetical protein LEP1GSC190_14940 [Leptospira mayottensis 200901116]